MTFCSSSLIFLTASNVLSLAACFSSSVCLVFKSRCTSSACTDSDKSVSISTDCLTNSICPAVIFTWLSLIRASFARLALIIIASIAKTASSSVLTYSTLCALTFAISSFMPRSIISNLSLRLFSSASLINMAISLEEKNACSLSCLCLSASLPTAIALYWSLALSIFVSCSK